MKHWPSQLFPIIILALLAGLTFWLQSRIATDEARHDGKLRHDPDAIAENFVARHFDQAGQLRYRLSAPYLEHYPDDDTSEIKAPTLVSYRANTPPVTVTADHATFTAKGEIAQLRDNVRLTRAATGTHPELVATTPDLTVHTEAGVAFTDSPVKITQGSSWITGVGAHIDHNASTFVLQSQVKGQFIRSRATP